MKSSGAAIGFWGLGSRGSSQVGTAHISTWTWGGGGGSILQQTEGEIALTGP